MALHLPIRPEVHGPISRLSEPTQRVCAWCGAVEAIAEDPGGETTHGLCRSCLEERTAEREPESGDKEPPSSSCE